MTLTAPSAWAAGAAAKDVLAGEEAAALSIVAKAKADAGEFLVAADMYREAWRMDTKVPGYVYSAARCAHKAGAWARALQDYERFRNLVTPADPAYAKAVEFEKEVRLEQERADKARTALEKVRIDSERQKADAARKKALESQRVDPTKPGLGVEKPVPAPAAEAAWRRPVGIGSLALGALALGGGSYLFLQGADQVTELQDRLATVDAKGRITGIDRDTALAQQHAANVDKGVGAALVGIGVAAAVAGTWLYWSGHDARVAVTPGGLLVAGDF